ncbi:MAG: ATP--guanido phosphotransferase [Clostridia bacterium]|nr:ATP--guanido phosphotransferase [Clostridia bacterium]
MSASLENEIVVSSRVRLARNFSDLPFQNHAQPKNAELCVQRAVAAFQPEEETYRLYLMRELSALEQTSLVEEHLISKDLAQSTDVGAALIREDHQLSIMINEEDHLRIQAMLPGMLLTQAAQLAFKADDTLQKVCDFSFDSQLGFLTACPTNTGTGMRASLMLHLPLLTICKQMGNINQSVAKLGLTIRGIYGEGSDALGDLYQVSNQVTLGRTEKEIIEAVEAVGHQLIDMENALRQQGMEKGEVSLRDRVQRAYGTLQYAMQMELGELMELWSSLRLGAALHLIPVSLETADRLLTIAQDAHVKSYAKRGGKAFSPAQARCAILKANLSPISKEV